MLQQKSVLSMSNLKTKQNKKRQKKPQHFLFTLNMCFSVIAKKSQRSSQQLWFCRITDVH